MDKGAPTSFYLASLQESCISDMIEITDDDTVRKYTAWYGETSNPPDQEVHGWYCRSFVENQHKLRFTRLVVDAKTDRCIGAIGGKPWPSDPRLPGNRFEIGYVIHKDYRGRGIGGAALKCYLIELKNFISNDKNMVVTAEICSTNMASIGMVKRAGFEHVEVQPKTRWEKKLRDGTIFHDIQEMYIFQINK